MRGRILVSLVVAAVAVRCTARQTPDTAVEPPAVPAARQAPAPAKPRGLSAFDEQVKPVLTRTCAPCHYPGGNMYELMPFDDAETVASHAGEILRRLKEPADRGLVEEWLRARAHGAPSGQ
jgi:hypothetical protein